MTIHQHQVKCRPKCVNERVFVLRKNLFDVLMENLNDGHEPQNTKVIYSI